MAATAVAGTIALGGAGPAAAVPAGEQAAVPAGDQQASAATQVAADTLAYQRAAATAAGAAASLAAAYATVGAADGEAQAAADGLAQVRGQIADQVLALYELGPTGGGALALLTADSPEDGMWQLSVGAPVAERLLDSGAARRRDAERRAAAADRLEQAALDAADRVDGLLTQLRAAQDAASWALISAQGELARLRQLAADQQAAQLAAQRLAQAQQLAEAAPLPPSASVGALPIPPDFERAYHDAATTCPGLSWTLLAAVGQVESGHGRNDGPSSAGAIGPMQFMPATFAAYAVDAEGDGHPDPWDTRDAVFTAAHYLCVSGAGRGPAGVHAALLTYNHAEWYVDLVLAAQAAIAAAYP